MTAMLIVNLIFFAFSLVLFFVSLRLRRLGVRELKEASSRLERAAEERKQAGVTMRKINAKANKKARARARARRGW